MSGSTFKIFYADETIAAVYDNAATSNATKNYKITYLNTKVSLGRLAMVHLFD
jgi:hypothetical protein